MVLTVSGTQNDRLQRGDVSPIYLFEMNTASGTLRFCSENALRYRGEIYQPYIKGVGTLRTSANFPDNNTSNKEIQLEIENAPVTWRGNDYAYLSNTFDVLPWELSEANVSVILLASGTVADDETAMPLVTSGIVGTPGSVTGSLALEALFGERAGGGEQAHLLRAWRGDRYLHVYCLRGWELIWLTRWRDVEAAADFTLRYQAFAQDIAEAAKLFGPLEAVQQGRTALVMSAGLAGHTDLILQHSEIRAYSSFTRWRSEGCFPSARCPPTRSRPR